MCRTHPAARRGNTIFVIVPSGGFVPGFLKHCSICIFLCSVDDRFTSQLLRAKKGWEGYLPSILHHLSSARFAGITSLRFTDKLRVCLYSAWHTVLVAYSIFLCRAVRDVELLARRKCLEMQGTRCRRRQLGLQPLNVCSFFCTYI